MGTTLALVTGSLRYGWAHPPADSAPVARSPRVVVVADAIGDPMVARVRDELELLGMAVQLQIATGASAQLASIASTAHAAAVVWVQPRPAEIVIWVDPTAEQEPYGPPSELRVSDSLIGDAHPDLLALRAVELLRGRLLPVESRRPPSPAAPLPPLTPPESVGKPAPGVPSPPLQPAAPPLQPAAPPPAARRLRGRGRFTAPSDGTRRGGRRPTRRPGRRFAEQRGPAHRVGVDAGARPRRPTGMAGRLANDATESGGDSGVVSTPNARRR